MKRTISILLLLLLLLCTGCSQKETVKTEEELRKEVKAELEAEEKLREELKAEIKAEMENEQTSSDTSSEDESINKAEKDTEITYTDDEMITTYAYLNNDSIDVSSLKKEEINLLEEIDAVVNTEYQEYKKEMVWKIAFFGTVKNVEIYQSPHYSVGPTKLYKYDVLTDTELSIIAREMGDEDAVFFVSFEDERGTLNKFTSWMAGRDIKKVELNSGFTKEEKTPTLYNDFDISPYLGCIGMNEKEFLNSEIGKKCTKQELFSEYDYVIEIADGIELIYHPDKEEVGEYEYKVKDNAEIMRISISRSVNDKGQVIDYETIPQNQRISIFGVDFTMTGVRAKKHFSETLDDYDISLITCISSENNEFDGIWIEPNQNTDTIDNGKDNEGKKAQNVADLNKDALIKSSKNNYYKFKANTNVYFDIDQDGTNEEIKYDSHKSKLAINGYKPIDIGLAEVFASESFIIINYSDSNITNMNMIGIYDPGPSADPVTTFYSIKESEGQKELTCVGRITAELIPASEYNNPNDFYDFSHKPSTDYLQHTGDFMSKAFLTENAGIDAPVMLTIKVPQVWFGRSVYTYNPKSGSLVDNYEAYGDDYTTYSVLEVIHDIKAYADKNSNSEYKIIKAGQNVLLHATDNELWIAMIAEDGTEGWVNIKDVTHDNFNGFVVFG